MPIGKIGETKLYLSYTILLAAAVVAIVIASETSQQRNADLPITGCIAVGIWVAGWGVQLFAHLTSVKSRGVQLDSVTVGILGVETRPHAWPVKASLAITLATGFSLLAIAFICLLPADGPLWRLPSIELTSPRSVWQAAAWLLAAQAACQVVPLPKTLGRQIVIGLTARFTQNADEATQVIIVRRTIIALALATALGAVALMSLENPLFGVPRWLLLSMLAVALGESARRRDIGEQISGFRVASKLTGDHEFSSGLLARGAVAMRTWRDRRRAKRVLEQEHREAVDASRLDEILSQLHQEGADSLSEEDRQILQRMSKSLRKHRDAESENDPAP